MEHDQQIVKFVSPKNWESKSTHNTKVAIDVDNHINEQDQSCQSSEIDLEDDNLDASNEVDRIFENQVDWHLLNNDQFSRELDMFIDIFAQQDLQDDVAYYTPNDV